MEQKIEIISIGNEILTGKTVNTNAAWMGHTLIEKGFSVSRVTVLPDDPHLIKTGVDEALSRAAIVITTGGIGPTMDDLTIPTLVKEGESSETIPNPVGWADGYLLRRGSGTLIILPGVPAQMEAIMTQEVIPFIEAHLEPTIFQRPIYFSVLSETRVDPLLRELEKEFPDVSLGICPSYQGLSVYMTVEAASREEADQKLEAIEKRITEPFSTYVISHEQKGVEHALQKAMIEKGKTFACAESCTGGAMAAHITALSGASDYFLGSIVSYSNQMKESALKVDPHTLEEKGAVSGEVVEEMLRGIFDLSGADYAIALSGIAGPSGGTPEKPVGTVWAAIGSKEGEIHVEQFEARGKAKRGLVIEYTVAYLLGKLWRWVEHGLHPNR